MIARSAALLISALILTTVSTTAGLIVSPGGYLSPLASPPLIGATGGINGSISMGNIYPTCRISPMTAPAPPYYSQVEVVVTLSSSSSSGLALTVPVNWVLLYGCTLHGTFKIGLNPGAYSLTLTSCSGIQPRVYVNSFLCSRFPTVITVDSGTWTQVTISITTGIY